MKFFAVKQVMLGLAVTAMVAGGIPLAAAQDASAPAAEAAQPGVASSAKPTKAERKAARKQARAKKNAELKKLEELFTLCGTGVRVGSLRPIRRVRAPSPALAGKIK